MSESEDEQIVVDTDYEEDLDDNNGDVETEEEIETEEF